MTSTIIDTAEAIYSKTQLEYVQDKLLNMPIEIDVPLPSEWAAENRYIPEGISNYYGMFDPSVTPHLIEPLDRVHTDDPCTHITMMKSVQSANTTTIGENAMGFFIRYKLGSILFLTSTKGMGNIRGSANIDTLIDNSNLAEYVKPMSNRSGRKIADNAMYKEFKGGIKLLITSYGSIADLKSNTWHLIIEDEWDEAGAELKDQGDIAGIIEGRTKGIRNFKIVQISTPSRMETSRIYKSFLEGDQREYFLPCPHCGERQKLVLKGSGVEYGLTFTREKDKETGHKLLIPETVRYICQHCKEPIYESKKQWMLENGVWIPGAVPKNRKKHSYHSPGMIAPTQMLSWERICQDFIETDFGKDVLKFKDFTINDLGNPWASVKKMASWEMLRDRSEEYTLGEVPEGTVRNISGENVYCGPLSLWGGCDVQGDRLELMVVGLGANGERWIIDKKVFYGNTADQNDGCWMALDDFTLSHTYKICGQDCYITLTAIDCGWDPRDAGGKREKDYGGKSHIVYDFVAPRPDRFIAVMGVGDEKTNSILKETRISDPGSILTKRYNVSVSLMKEVIMNIAEQKEGFGTIHVPKYQMIEGIKLPLDDDFYQQIMSERYQEDPKKPGTFKWTKIRARNENLDIFIYAAAAATYGNVTNWSNSAWIEYYNELTSA